MNTCTTQYIVLPLTKTSKSPCVCSQYQGGARSTVGLSQTEQERFRGQSQSRCFEFLHTHIIRKFCMVLHNKPVSTEWSMKNNIIHQKQVYIVNSENQDVSKIRSNRPYLLTERSRRSLKRCMYTSLRETKETL